MPTHPQIHGRADKATQDTIDQVRKVKKALERNLKAKLFVEGVAMQGFVEHVALLINRHQVGHDGKATYRRMHQREVPNSQF